MPPFAPSSSPTAAGGPSTDDLSEFYEDGPCGFLSLLPDGTIVGVNRTLLRSTGYDADDLVGRRTLQELLSPGARIYHATHWVPTLELRGQVREAPAELVRSDGSRLPVLLNGDLKRDADGQPAFVRVSIFDATDRRAYERELVAARDVERAARERVERLQRISAAISVALTPGDVATAMLGELIDVLGATWGRVLIGARRASTEFVLERDGPSALPLIGPEVGIVLPLAVAESFVGSLQLSFAGRRVVSAEERDFLEACAASGAQALRRAQLYVEVDTRSSQQAVVAALGSRALQTRELPVLLAEATDHVAETLHAERVRIVRDEAGDMPDQSAQMAIAIGSGAKRFGVIEVYAGEDQGFSGADVAFCEAIAHVLWNAVERRRADEQTRYQATHDTLTSLPNRILLEERLGFEIATAARSGSRFALYLVDLDDFKLVNDNFGHAAGDALLRGVAARLDAGVRGIDMVARLGGDEFAVICADIDADAEDALAERIVDVLSEPFHLEAGEHVLRVSTGVVFGDGTSQPEALLRDADVAMHRAKERGPGQYVRFDRSMLERGRHQLHVEGELRVAIAEGQLRVFYQPLVCASTGRLCSLEALVRWQHPERGLIPPDEFIPVAERSGLVTQLGAFVLEESCRQLVEWRSGGVVADDVSVAVNVSGVQLVGPDFAVEVGAALRRTGLDATPHLLGLEITESVLMRSADSPGKMLVQLADLGVGLHLDDFGTGASSLARLKRFPVDTLKIDRGFINGIGPGDSEDDAIVAAVIAMAAALGLHVVAEGVETEDQLGRLRALGCDLIQGYLISRPLAADAIAPTLAGLRGALTS